MIPGIIEAHVHSTHVANNILSGPPYRDYSNVEELQEVVRWLADQIPAGDWIVVPRVPITRLTERRHPTTAELDAACTTHPVVFTSARKSSVNSLALKKLGFEGDTVPEGVEVVRDAEGKVRLLGGAVGGLIRKQNPRKTHKPEDMMAEMKKIHAIYNSVGLPAFLKEQRRASNGICFSR